MEEEDEEDELEEEEVEEEVGRRRRTRRRRTRRRRTRTRRRTSRRWRTRRRGRKGVTIHIDANITIVLWIGLKKSHIQVEAEEAFGVGLGYTSIIFLSKCVFENCKMRRLP